jgi:ketosteroid isomerase-like protein
MSFFGTARDSGGAFENRLLVLFTFGADGRIRDTETFEAGAGEGAALARFDALGGGPREGDARPSRADRGFSNAATRLNERFARAWAERDWDTVSGAYVAGHHVDDRRRLMQMRLPDGDARAALRFLFDVPGSRWVVTPLATRGEHLVVSRYVFEGTAGADAGPIAIDYLAIDETNADGRFVETVLFDPDDLDAAYAELDRRYGAGDGRHDATWQQARRLAAALPHGDVDACRAMLAPGFRVRDHRKLSWGDTLRDADTFLQAQLALSELAPDWRYRIDHHRARGRVQLGQQAQVGTREGGAFENPFLVVSVLDQQGLTLGFDIYDVDQLEQARARFEELAGAQGSSASLDPVESCFSNAAVAAVTRGAGALAARNWEEFRALFADDFRNYDRRALFRVESGRDEWLAAFRPIVEMTSGAPKLEVLATRGDRLALVRMLWRGAGGDVGPSEIDWLLLIELGIDGRHRAVVTFDAGDTDSPYAELDERFMDEGSADLRVVAWVRDFAAAFEQRDWDAVAAGYAPDFVGHDHRLVSWGMLRGPTQFLETLRAMVDLAPDARMRSHHMRTSRRGFLTDSIWMGTRDGGAFESPYIAVGELADDGRAQRVDFYDPHHIDQAFARFREIAESIDPGLAVVTTPVADLLVPDAGSGTPPLHIPPNAAMRAMSSWFDAYDRAFGTGSWDELRRGCHPAFVFDDRRRMALLRGSVDLMVASARERAAMGARPEWHPVGFFGDRVFVMRVLWVGGPSDGPFEIEYLGVVECDENGLFTAFVLFDVDDARAVQREAWVRWAAIEPDVAAVLTPVGEALDAFNEKSAAKWRAAFADDLVVEDHRLAGMGRVEGADAYTESIVALWKLAPVTHADLGWRWPALDRHGAITVLRRTGTVPDGGGDFENEYLYLYVVAQGRLARVEMFEMDALDKALARFEELRGSSDEAQGDHPPLPRGNHRGVDDAEPPPSPLLGKEGGQDLLIPPNAATRGIDRWVEASLAGDADAVVALLDPSYTLEDRRPLFRTVSGRNTEIAVHLSLLHEGGWQPARTLLATAGDRLALQRWLWTKGESDAPSEIEFLEIDELGDSGRFVRSILFAPADRAAASRELMERYAALGAEGMPQATIEFIRGMNAHDLVRARSGISADFVFDDHRRAGTGRLEGADRYLESLSALWELIPDDGTELLYNVAVDRCGRVCVLRTWGHNREGGEVESLFVSLMHHPGEKLSLVELFEIEHLDVALARLADLRPGRTNAATRARDRQAAAFVAQDWDAVRRLAAADFVLEDRGKRALVTGDVEAWIASMQFTSQPGFRPSVTLIGTFGDRVALDRVVWSGEPGGDAFEFERIRVLEADAEGRMRAVIMFDPEDLWPASREAMMRFAAAESAAPVRGLVAWGEAQRAKRWDDLRTICTPDFVAVDRRPLGVLGTLDREQWVESLKAIVGLSDGVTYANHDVLAWNESGIVTAVARHGTIADGGGDIDDGFLAVMRVVDGRLVRLDVFAEHDTEGALACFDEQRSRR